MPRREANATRQTGKLTWAVREKCTQRRMFTLISVRGGQHVLREMLTKQRGAAQLFVETPLPSMNNKGIRFSPYQPKFLMNFILSLSKRIVLGISIALLVASSLVFNAAPAAAATYEVKMGTDSFQLAFSPKQVTAKPGDTIKFVNNKLAPHNVVFAKSPLTALGMPSGKLLFSSGQTYEVKIPGDIAAGTYDFYCTPHRGAGMRGKLIIK